MIANNSHLYVTAFLNATENFTLFPNVTNEGKKYQRGLLNSAVICLIIFTVVGVIGNLISIVALAKCPRLRNATTAFIINLCVADLIFCSYSSPIHALMYAKPEINYGESIMCKLVAFVTFGNGSISLYTVVAVTINRYIRIVHPKRYAGIYRPRHVAIMIVCLWTFFILILFLPFFKVWGSMGYRQENYACDILLLNGKSPRTLLFFTALALPTVVLIICYSKIYWAVREASIKVESVALRGTANPNLRPSANSASQVQERPKTRRNRKDIKVLKMTLVMFFAYVICYFPVCLKNVLGKGDRILSVSIVIFLMANLANCINPMIYIVMSAEFRRAYVDLFIYVKDLRCLSKNSSEGKGHSVTFTNTSSEDRTD